MILTGPLEISVNLELVELYAGKFQLYKGCKPDGIIGVI